MKYETGLVSIITPVFNSTETIEHTVKSVISQTYQKWEMMCVFDSGTTDSSRDIVRLYQKQDPRIHLIELQNEKGCGASRNEGFRQAKGQYIAFLDADDIWLPHKLEKQIAFMAKTGHSFSCTGYQRMNHAGVLFPKVLLPKPVAGYYDVLKNNTICCPSVIIDRTHVSPFQMKNTFGEDIILWLEILKKNHKCYGIQEVLLHYRVARNSRSSYLGKVLKARWIVYRNLEKISVMKSVYYFTWYFFTAIWKRR